jgi:hypothetical protein
MSEPFGDARYRTLPSIANRVPRMLDDHAVSFCSSPATAVSRSAFACFFLHVIGLPPYTIEVGFPRFPRRNDLRRIHFSRLQPFTFRPPVLLASPIVPTAAIAAGQPRLLRPSRTGFVASACIGSANHPPRQLVVWGLYDLLKPRVDKLVVCNPRKNALLKDGNKSDRIDARKPAELLRGNQLKPVYHGETRVGMLRELTLLLPEEY